MKRIFLLFLIISMFFSSDLQAFAAERKWTGYAFISKNTDMSYWPNWKWGKVPGSGDTLLFSSDYSYLVDPYNDFNGYTFSGITFTENSKTTSLLGNSIKLSGNISNDSTESLQTIKWGITLLKNVNIYSGDGSYNLKLDGVISGGHGISKRGGSTLTLGGANTYTGTTTISEGTLNLGVANAIPSKSAVTVGSGATLSLNGYNDTVASLAGPGTVNNNSATDVTLTVGDTTSTTFSGLLVNGSTGKLGLTKQGSGALTLTGANTFTGITNVNVGVLNIRNNTATGTTAGGVAVASGAALQLQHNIAVGVESLTLNGLGISSDGAMRNISGNNSWAGAIALGSATRINSDSGTLTLSGNITGAGQNLTVGGSANTSISGVIGTTTGTLTKDGSGILTLTGASTYAGVTKISAGTLSINTIANGGTASSIGASTNAAKNLVFDGGTLYYTGADVTTNRNFTINADKTATIDVTSHNLTISGAAAATNGALVKTGAGTLTLKGANLYTGTTTVNGLGTLVLDYSDGNSSRISETAALILGGGTLSLNGGAYTQVVASTTLNAGESHITRPSGDSVLQMNTITVNRGTIDFGAGGIASTNNDNDPLTGYLGTWATIGGATWAKKDAGAGVNGLIVAFDNFVNIANYNSTIANVSANKVRINSEGTGVPSNPIALGADTTTIESLLQNWTSAATVDTAGKTLRTNGIFVGENKAALTIGSAVGDGFLTSATSGGDLNLINHSNIASLTINAVIADNTSASGLVKAGDGTLVLNGVNTYTGDTFVDAGTLTLNESLLLSSGLIFGEESTVNLADGKTITPNITTDLDDQGTLNFAGDGTASGQVGAANLSLESVKISGAGKTVNFSGDIYATTLSFLADGTAAIASGMSIVGAVDNNSGTNNWGTLTLSGGNQSVSGAIGTTKALKTINVGSGLGATATFSESVKSQTIAMSGVGKAQFNGAVTATALNIASTGEAEINTESGITTTTFTGAGTLDLNETLTGDIAFGLGGDGTVTLLGGKNITGTVDNTSGSNNVGTLTIEAGGGSTISGAVGATKTLKILNVHSGSGTTATFSGAVKAQTINMSGLGIADFIDSVTATTLHINTGALVLNESSTLGTTTVSNGAHLQLKSDATILGTTILNLNGTGQFSAGAFQNISGNNTWNGDISLKSSSLIHSYADSLTISGTDITGAAKDLTIDGPGDIIISSAIETTTGMLTKNGSGTLTLGGTNTYTGATTINVGMLDLTGSLNDAGAVILDNVSGAILRLNGDETIGSISGGGTIGGDVNLNGANTLTVGDDNNTTYEGIISGALGGITKQGAGTLTLTGANTYTGVTKITAGTLSVDTIANGGTASSIGASTNAAANLVFDGGTLYYTGVDTSTDRNFTINADKTATINVASNNLTISGAAAATNGALTKTGSGTLTLAGVNLNTGATTLSEGTLALDYSTEDNSKISETAALTLGGGTISLIGGTYTQDVASTTLSAGDSFITRLSGAAVLDMGLITVADGATINFNAASIAKTTTNNDPVTGMLGTWATFAEGGWAKKDAGAGASGFIIAFDGYTDINAYGGLIANGANQVRIQYQGTSGNITMDSDVTAINTILQNTSYAATVDTAGKTLRVNGIMVGDGKAALTIGSAAGDGILTSATLNGDIDIINHSNNELLTINAVIANNGGASKLTKAGDGTLVLNGVNTYTGNTIVSAGTLNLNQSLLTSSGLVFGGSATVNLADGKTITPNITTDVNDQGTLTLLGSGTISGQVGAAGAYLTEINAGATDKTTTFGSAVFATTINTSGTANFNGNVNTTTFNLETDSTATIASGKNLTGEVKASSGSGTLTLAGGGQTITGDIGTASDSWLGTINVEGSGTATFSGAILTEYFNITGDRTVIFSDDVETLNDFTLSSDSIVTLADNKNMTLGSGGITSPSGQGTLTLSGEHTITGNIGSTLLGNSGLKLLTVGNAAVNIEGNIKAVTVNFVGDNELTVGNGYGITGAVTTTTDNTGTLTFAGSTSTGGAIGASGKALKVLNFNGATSLSHNIFATNTYIKSGSTVTMTGDTGITGNLTLNNASDAVLDLGLNTLTLTGNYTQSDDSSLKISLSDADWGVIDATGSPDISGLSTLDINVTGLLTSGAAFTVIDCDSAGSIGDLNIIWDSPIFTIRRTTSNEDLIVHVTRYKTYTEMGLNSNAAAVGQVLDDILPSAVGDMRNVLAELDALGSQQEVSNALDSMEPLTDGAQTTVTNNVLNQFIGTTILRLQDSKIEEDNVEDIVKESNLENDVWIQFYGDYAHQGKRGLSNGYLANMWGTVIGIDRLFIEGDLRLGLAQGFGFSKINSKDNYGHTSIDSYQTGIYGEYQAKDSPYILDAVLTYGYNDYDSSRNISVGGIDRTAKSDYYGQQFSSYLEAGYKIQKEGFDIIPLLALNYSCLYLPKYTETGAGSLNLTVDSQKYNSLQPGVGLRLSKVFENKSGIFTPEIRLRYFYDTINDEQQTIATFAGGGASFKTEGYKPAPSSFDFGARVEFFNKKNITILADCDTEFKDGYYEVGGSITFKYSF